MVLSKISLVLSSTFVLILLWLVAFDGFINIARPLRWFNDSGFTTINQNFLVSKLPEILNSNQNQDVLLLGSSVVQVPVVRCDDKLLGKKTRYDRWYYRNYIDEYSNAAYLEKLLSLKLHSNVSVCNAAVAASVMSDDFLIAKKYMDAGKTPKLVVLCVAPREFMDRARTRVDKTATYSILGDFTSIVEMWDKKSSPPEILSNLLTMGWSFYRNRCDYKSTVVAAASKISGHPMTLYSATHAKADAEAEAKIPESLKKDAGVLDQTKAVYVQPTNTLEDIKAYTGMYLPFDEQQFQTQSTYLTKFLSLMQKKGIPTLVVDVPLTKENYELLPKDKLDRYHNLLAQSCNKYGAVLEIPFERVSFDSIKDYEDSVHLNGSGGEKLFMSMLDSVSGSPLLAGALTGPRNIASTRESH